MSGCGSATMEGGGRKQECRPASCDGESGVERGSRAESQKGDQLHSTPTVKRKFSGAVPPRLWGS